MSLHGYPTRVDEYDSEEEEIYHRSPYQSPRFQRRLSLQKPAPSRFNPGYYGPEDEDEDGLDLPIHGMNLADYPPRWTSPPQPFFEEAHPLPPPGYIRRPFFAPEEEYPYFPGAMRPPPPQFWAQHPANDLRYQSDRLSDNEIAREMPYLHRSFSSRSHRQDRPNHRPLPRRFQDLEDENDDEPPLFRRSSTGSRKLPLQHQQQHQQQQQQQRRRRANSLSSMPNQYPPHHHHHHHQQHPKDRIRSNATTPYPSDDNMDNTSEEGDLSIPLRGGPGLNRSQSFGNFPPPPHPPPMQPNIQPVMLPQNVPIENGPPPPMGPPNSMFVPQPGDYFEPRMNNNQEGTGPSTSSANEANGSQNSGNNGMAPPMGPWMGHPHQGPPVFPTSPGSNNPMFNQQNMMAMGMANPMVNMFNNPMMPQPMWGFPNYPLPFMNAGEPPMVNPDSTSPHRNNENELPRPDSGNHEHLHQPPLHQPHPEMQTPHMHPPPPLQSMVKPESSRRRFSIFNLFGKKNEYHFEPPMQQPFPEDQFRGGAPMPPPGGVFPGAFSVPIQDRSSKKEQKKIEQYEKLGGVWAWRIIQDPENLDNTQMYCREVDPNRFYSFNINNQKLINKKLKKEEVMLGSEKLLQGDLMIRPPLRDAFFIPRNLPNRSEPVVIHLEIIYQNFNRGELGNGFVLNHM